MSTTRYEQGWQQLTSIDGQAGQTVIDSLEAICPDLGRYIIEFAFGDLYSRPGLDLRAREIATVAALTVQGHSAPQLKVHLQAALNVGCQPAELIEVILQMVAYAGFPAAINAMQIAKEVFREHPLLPATAVK